MKLKQFNFKKVKFSKIKLNKIFRELLKKKYTQTFQVSNGFINDLSILDLIFNCGPDSKNYF